MADRQRSERTQLVDACRTYNINVRAAVELLAEHLNQDVRVCGTL